jgi:putative transposase
MRFVPQRPLVDAPLSERVVALAAEHPRWRVPRLHWRLRREGWKRVDRLYRLEGLAVRRRKRKRLAVPRVSRPAAVGPNATWSLDFVRDQLSDGRRLRCLTLIGSCTRECLAITVAHSIPSTAVITTRGSVIAARGRPTRLSLDNGSEFRCRTFDAWAAARGIALPFIQPGKPVQNAHVEIFNGKYRGKCLNQHWFLSLLDAQFHVEHYRRAFNTALPHGACHRLTLHECARTFTAAPLSA